jgi:hypothetical protein
MDRTDELFEGGAGVMRAASNWTLPNSNKTLRQTRKQVRINNVVSNNPCKIIGALLPVGAITASHEFSPLEAHDFCFHHCKLQAREHYMWSNHEPTADPQEIVHSYCEISKLQL